MLMSAEAMGRTGRQANSINGVGKRKFRERSRRRYKKVKQIVESESLSDELETTSKKNEDEYVNPFESEESLTTTTGKPKTTPIMMVRLHAARKHIGYHKLFTRTHSEETHLHKIKLRRKKLKEKMLSTTTAKPVQDSTMPPPPVSTTPSIGNGLSPIIQGRGIFPVPITLTAPPPLPVLPSTAVPSAVPDTTSQPTPQNLNLPPSLPAFAFGRGIMGNPIESGPSSTATPCSAPCSAVPLTTTLLPCKTTTAETTIPTTTVPPTSTTTAAPTLEKPGPPVPMGRSLLPAPQRQISENRPKGPKKDPLLTIIKLAARLARIPVVKRRIELSNSGEQDLEVVEQFLASVYGNETGVPEVPPMKGRNVQAVPKSKTEAKRPVSKHKQHKARKMSSEETASIETVTKAPYTIEITLVAPDESIPTPPPAESGTAGAQVKVSVASAAASTQVRLAGESFTEAPTTPKATLATTTKATPKTTSKATPKTTSKATPKTTPKAAPKTTKKTTAKPTTKKPAAAGKGRSFAATLPKATILLPEATVKVSMGDLDTEGSQIHVVAEAGDQIGLGAKETTTKGPKRGRGLVDGQLPSIDHMGHILTLPPKVMNLDGAMVKVSMARADTHGRKVNAGVDADPFVGPAAVARPPSSTGAKQLSFGPISGRNVMALLQKSKKKDPVLTIMRLALKLAKSPKVQELLDGPESGEHDLDAIHRYLHVVRAHRHAGGDQGGNDVSQEKPTSGTEMLEISPTTETPINVTDTMPTEQTVTVEPLFEQTPTTQEAEQAVLNDMLQESSKLERKRDLETSQESSSAIFKVLTIAESVLETAKQNAVDNEV